MRVIFMIGFLAVVVVTAGCGTVSLSQGNDVAANVNGHDISMSAYTLEVGYQRVVSADSSGIDVCDVKDMVGLCRQLKQTALTTLIDEELVRQYAATHHIQLTNAEFQRQWAGIYANQDHNLMTVLRAHAQHLKLTVAQYEAAVRQGLLQQKVEYSVTRTMPLTAPAVKLSRIVAATPKQMTAIQSELHAGTTFDGLAARLASSSHNLCYQAGCGSMGWVPVYFISQAEHKAVTAPVGSVVGPIPGQSMIELLKVEGRSPAVSMTPQEQQKRRDQLFAVWLKHQEHKASVKRYVTT